MKKVLSLAVLVVMAFTLTACAENAPDYSQKKNWYKFPEITKDADTFYINSTSYVFDSLKEDSPEYSPLDNEEMLARFPEEYLVHATVFEECTNIFMPYYRQAGMRVMKKSWLETGDIDAAISGIPYSDITAALDYYFTNCNNGRPFIIAGHSQGSALVRLVLKKYFAEHPDYYERMIAAYVIGYSVTKDDLKNCPHLKFVTGETDTGVIISWNTEGPMNVKQNASNIVVLPGAISINPLNWKLDETYAPASENLGSLIVNEKGEHVIADVGADAQINLARGVVVTNAKADPMPEEAARITLEYFGPDVRHDNDYTYYYSNIKANAAKRVAAYMAKAKAPDYSQKKNWYKFPEITKDADTFYINSTSYVFDSLKEDSPEYSPLDNEEMLARFPEEYLVHATVFEECTNIFMPYYRQAGMRVMKKSWLETGDIDAAISGIPYSDITAALDYYFTNCNNGRPFIIAGHSQGSALVRLVLKKYFAEHPDYYKRMIAAYAIGYSVTKDDLKAYPHLKFAEGETDTGVIISWNTEGKENVEGNIKTAVVLPGAISINPLNWKLDETYAPSSENLGSLTENEKGEPVIADIGADAQIILSRGTVLTHAKPKPMPEEAAKITAEYFGPGARHDNDYTFYYSNIKENVAKRIAAYKAGK